MRYIIIMMHACYVFMLCCVCYALYASLFSRVSSQILGWSHDRFRSVNTLTSKNSHHKIWTYIKLYEYAIIRAIHFKFPPSNYVEPSDAMHLVTFVQASHKIISSHSFPHGFPRAGTKKGECWYFYILYCFILFCFWVWITRSQNLP